MKIKFRKGKVKITLSVAEAQRVERDLRDARILQGYTFEEAHHSALYWALPIGDTPYATLDHQGHEETRKDESGS